MHNFAFLILSLDSRIPQPFPLECVHYYIAAQGCRGTHVQWTVVMVGGVLVIVFLIAIWATTLGI